MNTKQKLNLKQIGLKDYTVVPYQNESHSTDVEALVGVRKFSRVETGMGVTFRP